MNWGDYNLKNISTGEFRISGLNKGKKGTVGSIDCESEKR